MGRVPGSSGREERRRRVCDVISWPVDPTPPELRLGRWAGFAAGLTAGVVLAGLSRDAGSDGLVPLGPSVETVLPADPDQPVILVAAVTGTAPWLPPSWVLPVAVHADQRYAWIEPGYRSSRRTVPLHELRLTAARSRSRSRRPRHPTAPWDLRVSGPEMELELTGSWLSLGWLAHLANWPPP